MNNFWNENPEQFIELENESRKAYLHPLIIDLINTLKPKSILDYGCGNGSLFADEGIQPEIELGIYDSSLKMLDIAAANLSHKNPAVYTRNEDIPTNKFDCVVMSLILMTVSSVEEQSFIIHNAIRAKKDDAPVIFTITHPCFRQMIFSTFKTEFSGKEFDYFDEGREFEVEIRDSVNTKQVVKFKDYHWKLSTILNLIIESGLSLMKIIEVADEPVSNSEYNRNFPGYIVILAI